MALCRQVIDLVWLHLLDYPDEVGRIREVAVVKNKPSVRLMGVLVKVIDTIRVERGRPPFDAMDLVSLFEQELGQICPILASDSSDQRFLHFRYRK